MTKPTIVGPLKKLSTLACTFITAFAMSAPAQADLIFDWTGDCVTGCTGTATGVLTIADTYLGGFSSDPADFISFEFVSDTASHTFNGLVGLGATFSFDSSTSEFAGITTVDSPAPFTRILSFITDSSQNWGFLDQANSMIVMDLKGTGGSLSQRRNLTPVPTPAPLALLGLGLVGIALRNRRKV